MPVPTLCRRAPFPCSFSYANVLNVKPLTFSGPGTPSAALAQGQLGCFTRGCSVLGRGDTLTCPRPPADSVHPADAGVCGPGSWLATHVGDERRQL
jgi:hypothetical protein